MEEKSRHRMREGTLINRDTADTAQSADPGLRSSFTTGGAPEDVDRSMESSRLTHSLGRSASRRCDTLHKEGRKKQVLLRRCKQGGLCEVYVMIDSFRMCVYDNGDGALY